MTEWRTTPAEELAERLASANADRHRLAVLLEEAVADRDLLGDAGAAVVAVLRKTLYSPPDFNGPPVWWLDESRAALKLWEDACSSIVPTAMGRKESYSARLRREGGMSVSGKFAEENTGVAIEEERRIHEMRRVEGQRILDERNTLFAAIERYADTLILDQPLDETVPLSRGVVAHDLREFLHFAREGGLLKGEQ